MLKEKPGIKTILFLLLLICIIDNTVCASEKSVAELLQATLPYTIAKENWTKRTRQPLPPPVSEPEIESEPELKLEPGLDLDLPLPPPTRKIALTFDDGPDLRYTPQLLDILEAEQIKATFFVIGERVEWYPDVLKRIFAEGHLIANHSHTHLDFADLTNEEIIQYELDPTSRAVEKLTGYYPKIMRPPYGSLRTDSAQFLTTAGWRIVRWSLDTFDWDSTKNKPQEIIARITKNHHNNAIILMHCNNKVTVEVLPDVIKTLRSLGYEFVTVSQLS